MLLNPKWPHWVKLAAALANDEDAGVGDTIARIVGPLGGNAYKAWRASIGHPCNCAFRQQRLNNQFPYK